jgi:hypothetical protein
MGDQSKRMTVGTTVRQTPKKLYAQEVVLFRTHAEILTDQRLIVRGSSVPFETIRVVEVVPLIWFWPLQALRLLAVIAAARLLLSAPDAALPQILASGALLAAAFAARWVIPTHALRLRTEDGIVRVLRDGDRAYLRTIERKIRNAKADYDRSRMV